MEDKNYRYVSVNLIFTQSYPSPKPFTYIFFIKSSIYFFS